MLIYLFYFILFKGSNSISTRYDELLLNIEHQCDLIMKETNETSSIMASANETQQKLYNAYQKVNFIKLS